MLVPTAVSIRPHDVALRVNRIRFGVNSSGYIDGGKFTLAQQKTMTVTAAVKIEPHDVPSRVDPKRLRKCGSRHIDGDKFTLAQQKTMTVAAAVKIEPDDVALRIRSLRGRARGSRHIDCCELLLRGKYNRGRYHSQGDDGCDQSQCFGFRTVSSPHITQLKYAK